MCPQWGGYDEVYPSGLNDPSTSPNDRVPSSNSPSAEGDKDMNVDESEDSSEEYIVSDEPPSQSVVGLDGLREFILLPL